jgi:hypothetical protein
MNDFETGGYSDAAPPVRSADPAELLRKVTALGLTTASPSS